MTLSTLPRARVTIGDVAAHAKVSKASVSRFIGEDRALLSDAIALRIEHAIDLLGYRPNQMARGLKRGRTRLVGMLVADIRNPYSVALVHGVETACRAAGYSLVVCNTDSDPEQERLQLQALRGYNVEGLILNTLGRHPDELSELAQELPLVLVDRKVQGLDCDLVGLDNAQAIRLGLSHLAERGYRDIALVTQPESGISSRNERIATFSAACPGAPVLETEQDLIDPLQTFLAAPGAGPKALLCANGVAALACTLALNAAGIAVPNAVGLIALDDLDWYPLVAGGVTALAQPTQTIGAAAFEALRVRLGGRPSAKPQQQFAAQLIIRGSTPVRA